MEGTNPVHHMNYVSVAFECRKLPEQLSRKVIAMATRTPCKLALFSWFGYDLPLSQRLELVRKARFDATSLWWGDDEEMYRTGMKHHMPELAREHGLLLEYVHVPSHGSSDLWSNTCSVREAVVQEHTGWLEDCARHKIPVLVMHMSRRDMPCETLYAVESIHRIVSAAESLGVVVALENTRVQRDIEEVLRQVQSPYLGLCYDTSHDWLYGDEKGSLLRNLGDLLVTTHLSDNDGVRDLHSLPGDGVVDWSIVARSFQSATYSGFLSLELTGNHGKESISPAAYTRLAFERAAWVSEQIREANS